MPFRNIWSLEPGECIVAETLLEKLKNCEIYFPLHDTGIDLLVVRGKKCIGLQVKESRYFTHRLRKGGLRGHSWHQIHKRKFIRDRKRVDFYVFLTYLPRYGEYTVSSFENRFIIVPTSTLEKLIKIKKPAKGEIYSFYFHFEGKKAVEIRDKKVGDYSKYVNNWKLIDEALK